MSISQDQSSNLSVFGVLCLRPAKGHGIFSAPLCPPLGRVLVQKSLTSPQAGMWDSCLPFFPATTGVQAHATNALGEGHQVGEGWGWKSMDIPRQEQDKGRREHRIPKREEEGRGPHSPATSNSTSNTTLWASAAFRSSWLASSIVPSSVAIPLMDRTRSPTCSSPHLNPGQPHREKPLCYHHCQSWGTGMPCGGGAGV